MCLSRAQPKGLTESSCEAAVQETRAERGFSSLSLLAMVAEVALHQACGRPRSAGIHPTLGAHGSQAVLSPLSHECSAAGDSGFDNGQAVA